ncbi:retrovirus-related pol polyprotein from transposon TNT 1-94 [Tanacetum coccineum]
MTRDHSQLTNFVHKFLDTVKFDNDQIEKIMGYGDYQIGYITISRVYYVEGLGHNLFSVGQFYDSDLEVAFRKHTCFVRNLEGVDLLSGSEETNLYTLSIGDMMAPSPICLLSKALKTKSWNIHTYNGTEFVNQILRSYYESVGISHETSVVRTPQQNGVVKRRNRTLVEDARTMLIYAKAYLFLWAEAVATFRLVTNNIPQQPCNPPKRDDYDRFFQPIFDKYFNPLTIVVSPVLVTDAPRAVDLADSPVSTSINQDAPSTSIPSTQEQEYSLIFSQGFKESPKMPHFHDDPLHESLHEDSTSRGSSSNMRPIHTPFESLDRWTKDHPIANIIEGPSRSVSTRKQLETDAM